MAIRVSCNRCTKRISIDEAFAGGVCRCPYCTAINNVPGGHRGSQVAQKSADAVGAKAVTRETPPSQIPVADRVVFQGITAMALMAMLVAFVVVAIVLIVKATGGGDSNGRPPALSNPFVPGKGASIAGVPVRSPVVYVIDSSRSMELAYDYAVQMAGASMQSLPAGAKAAVVVALETGTHSTGSLVAMPSGRSLVTGVAGEVDPYGNADLGAAMDEAMGMQPATIVLFVRKYVDDLVGRADRAKQQGVTLVVIVLGGRPDMVDGADALAKRADGRCCSFALEQLARWRRERANP